MLKKTGNENDIKIYTYRYIKFFSRFTVNINNVYKMCIQPDINGVWNINIIFSRLFVIVHQWKEYFIGDGT